MKTLIRFYWEAVLPELGDPELIVLAQEEIAKVGDVELVEVNLGRTTASMHALKEALPPKLQ